MPTLQRLCATSGCGQIATSALCDDCRAAKKERRRQTDRKRPNSAQREYDRTWARARGRYLKVHPNCETPGCGAPAVEVDHIIPLARGGDRLKWSNLQAQCRTCHSRKTIAENRGAGGRVAPRGEWNDLMYPKDLPRPSYPVTIVAGPPGAGKNTYVEREAKKGDVLCDLDRFKEHASSLREAIAMRNQALRELTEARRLWLIVMAPEPWERAFWARALGADVVLVEADLATCIQRIRSSGRDVAGRIKGAQGWWDRFAPCELDRPAT